jgi:hypothetical protein
VVWWHVTIAAEGRCTLFEGEGALRVGVRTLVRVAPGCLLFGVVDDHVHVVSRGDRAQVAHAASAISRALAHAGAPPLQRAHLREVGGRAHLESLVGYLARQPVKHGLRVRPATHAGSCVQDLGGARWLAGFDRRRIADALPRFDAFGAALAAIGWRGNALTELDDTYLRQRTADELWETVSAAACVDPADRTRGREALAARVAYVHLVRAGGHGREAGCAAVELPARTWTRLAATAPEPALLSAVRKRLHLEAAERKAAAAAEAARVAMATSSTMARHPPGSGPRPEGREGR